MTKIHLPFVSKEVEDLLLWRDVPKSAGALAAATAAYFVVELSGTPLLTWVSLSLLTAAVVTLVWSFGAKFAGIAGPSAHFPKLLVTGIDEATARTAAERVRVLANKGLAFLARLLSGDDAVLTTKTGLALFFVGKVGRIITPVGLLYTAVLLAFSLPKLYEMRKDDVDRAAAAARSNVAANYEVARAKLNEAITPIKQRFATPHKAARPVSAESDKTE